MTAPGRFWRLWLADRARLVGPFSSQSPDARYREPWPPRRSVEAWCDRDHQPPAPDCECGLRGMPSPRDVFASAAMARWLDFGTWTVPPLAAAAGIILVIGRVDLSGRMAGPSPNDPPPCLRGQFAQVVGPLYVSPNGLPAGELGHHYGLRVRPLQHLVRKAAREMS